MRISTPGRVGPTGSTLDHLRCPRCERRHDADRPTGLCACGSPLLAHYDLDRAAETFRPDPIAAREPSMWRYRELLPVRDGRYVTTLGEPMTPLLPLTRLGGALDVPGLLMKDEGGLPGGTFKTRGAAVGVSRARELGATGIAMPTNGNAGAAWAQYAARAGLRCLITMPAGAPEITRRECLAAGAELHVVPGHIGDAARRLAEVLGRKALQTEAGGDVADAVEPVDAASAVSTADAANAADDRRYLDASTLKEPYRIEGKKTMAFEIVEQLGWRLPSVIVYPTGGGVGIIGIHKALGELRALGLISGPLPRLVAVQSTGCAPIVRAFEAGAADSTALPDPATMAFGINVPKPLGDFLILRAVRETDGCAIAVPDAEILELQAACARLEGALICPEGAATLAAVRQLRVNNWIGADDDVVVLNTGTGLKYPETLPLGPTASG